MDEDHHWKDDSVDNLATVTPVMNFLLDRKEIFNAHFSEALTCLFLMMDTHNGD